MTLGQKLKEIRKKIGLSQEQLAEIMNVSRQAITKWENDRGVPDISNLQELSKVFGITIDYLLDEKNELPLLSIRKKIDKEKYPNKLKMYEEVLKEYFPEPAEIYSLIRSKKLSILEWIIELFVAPDIGPVTTADMVSDTSPYYLVKKENVKLLVNIKDYVIESVYLPVNTNEKHFTYKKIYL